MGQRDIMGYGTLGWNVANEWEVETLRWNGMWKHWDGIGCRNARVEWEVEMLRWNGMWNHWDGIGCGITRVEWDF